MKEIEFDNKFKALQDETRREIIWLLKTGKKCAGEIASQFTISAASISYHLNFLAKSKLIIAHKEKGFIFYELNVRELDEVMDWLEKIQPSKSNLPKV